IGKSSDPLWRGPVEGGGGVGVDLPTGAIVDDHATAVYGGVVDVDRVLVGDDRFVAGKGDRGEVGFLWNPGRQFFRRPLARVAEQQPLLADGVAARGIAGV